MLSPNLPSPRLILLASLLLASCALNPKHQGSSGSLNSPKWLKHQQAVEKVTRYQTRGAFTYISYQQKMYARFNWQQISPDRYRLLLTSPLGSTELRLDQQGQITHIIDNKGNHYVGNDATKMISQLIGIIIPIDNLRQWMVGLPGDSTDYRLDDHFRLGELNYAQNGKQWHVTYQGYNSKQNPKMPSNIELKQGSVRIKLKMDSWVLK